jgi:predicted dehydrogenase
MSYQRDYARRLDVAVVGAGSHAYRNILPTLHYLPVHLRAICDVNLPLAQKTAEEYGCAAFASTKELYAAQELDAVFIAVGPQLHPALAIEAFAAGVHVWLGKPVAMRAGEVRQMIQARADRCAVVGFKKVFMPATQKALEIVRSPKYGGLRSMLAVYPMDLPADGRGVLENRQFTNWLANGVHPLSLLLAVGGKAQNVTAIRGKLGGGAVVLEFANGVTATFHLASGPNPIERYQFFADKWHLEIDNCLRVKLERGMPFHYGVTTEFTPPGDDSGAVVWEPQNCLATLENKALFTQGIWGEMKHFCDCVLAGKPAEVGTLEFALHVMQVYEAALLSQGQPLTIGD